MGVRRERVRALRSTRLKHFPRLEMSPRFLEGRFARDCRTDRCDGTCCRTGVLVDIEERDRILSHAALVRASMDPGQEHDPARWFEVKEATDGDFPSGRAVGTHVGPGGCVFLNARRLCVLQLATIAAAREGFDLKPFFCTAYPLTIVNATLTIDDADFTERPACCSTVPDGELSVIDVCRMELVHVLGPDGFDEVRALMAQDPRV